MSLFFKFLFGLALFKQKKKRKLKIKSKFKLFEIRKITIACNGKRTYSLKIKDIKNYERTTTLHNDIKDKTNGMKNVLLIERFWTKHENTKGAQKFKKKTN